MSSVAKIATRIGLGIAFLGLASCCLNLFGFEVRALRALDGWGPIAAWGLRIGLIVVGAILAVGGMFFDPDEDPEHRAEVARAEVGRAVSEVGAFAADPRIAQFLRDLSQQAQLSLEVPTDPSIYQVVRILFTDVRGSWFRGHTTTTLGPNDPEAVGTIVCLERQSGAPTHVLASRTFASPETHIQPTDHATFDTMARAGT